MFGAKFGSTLVMNSARIFEHIKLTMSFIKAVKKLKYSFRLNNAKPYF